MTEGGWPQGKRTRGRQFQAATPRSPICVFWPAARTRRGWHGESSRCASSSPSAGYRTTEPRVLLISRPGSPRLHFESCLSFFSDDIDSSQLVRDRGFHLPYGGGLYIWIIYVDYIYGLYMWIIYMDYICGFALPARGFTASCVCPGDGRVRGDIQAVHHGVGPVGGVPPLRRRLTTHRSAPSISEKRLTLSRFGGRRRGPAQSGGVRPAHPRLREVSGHDQ